jgi:hypothetical protein
MFFIQSMLWVVEQIQDAMMQEQDKEEEEIKLQLCELYKRLESGLLGEQEFEAQEAQLLDRLDAIVALREAALAAAGVDPSGSAGIFSGEAPSQAVDLAGHERKMEDGTG